VEGKLVGIATDGARNMTGRHSSPVTRLASGAFPGSYRIWCGAHQLDLVFQEVMSGLCEEAFYGTLTSCIIHLRRQQNFVSSMKTTCPKVASKRWLSVGRVCNSFGKHHDTIVDDFEAKAPPASANPMWWIMLLSVRAFMVPVDLCLNNMQGLTTLKHEQYVMFRNLITNLKLLLEVEGLMSTEAVTTRPADVQRVTLGSYSATRVSIRNFVSDREQFALVRWTALPDNGERDLEESIGVLFLYAIESISSIAVERDSSNGVTSDKLPPVIPRDLSKIAPRELNEVVLQESQRSTSLGLEA
jgi:hypothetical protein